MNSCPAEAVSYARANLHQAIELLQARYTHHTFSPHFHESFAIGAVEARALTHACHNRFQNIISAGEMMVIFPGEVHTGKPVGSHGVTYRMMYLPAALLSEFFQPDCPHNELMQPPYPEESRRFQPVQQFIQLHQLLQEAGRSALEQECALISTLAQIFRPGMPHPSHSPADTVHHRGVAAAKDYLSAHFAEAVSLQQLAVLANLSPHHFLRIFQRQVGLSPHTFQTQLRVEQAKRLLRQNILPSQIGLQVGFYDQSHFIKAFKTLVGVTPGKYLSQTD